MVSFSVEDVEIYGASPTSNLLTSYSFWCLCVYLLSHNNYIFLGRSSTRPSINPSITYSLIFITVFSWCTEKIWTVSCPFKLWSPTFFTPTLSWLFLFFDKKFWTGYFNSEVCLLQRLILYLWRIESYQSCRLNIYTYWSQFLGIVTYFCQFRNDINTVTRLQPRYRCMYGIHLYAFAGNRIYTSGFVNASTILYKWYIHKWK